MIDICEHLEGMARQLVEENGLKSGGGGAGGGAQVRSGGVGLRCDGMKWGPSQVEVTLQSGLSQVGGVSVRWG